MKGYEQCFIFLFYLFIYIYIFIFFIFYIGCKAVECLEVRGNGKLMLRVGGEN